MNCRHELAQRPPPLRVALARPLIRPVSPILELIDPRSGRRRRPRHRAARAPNRAAGRHHSISWLHRVRRHRGHRSFLRHRLFPARASDRRSYRQFRRTRSPYGTSRGKVGNAAVGSHLVRGPVAFRARASGRRGAGECCTNRAVRRESADGGCDRAWNDARHDRACRVGAGFDTTLHDGDATRPKITSERDRRDAGWAARARPQADHGAKRRRILGLNGLKMRRPKSYTVWLPTSSMRRHGWSTIRSSRYGGFARGPEPVSFVDRIRGPGARQGRRRMP